MHDTNPKKKVNMSRKDEILNSKNELLLFKIKWEALGGLLFTILPCLRENVKKNTK